MTKIHQKTVFIISKGPFLHAVGDLEHGDWLYSSSSLHSPHKSRRRGLHQEDLILTVFKILSRMRKCIRIITLRLEERHVITLTKFVIWLPSLLKICLLETLEQCLLVTAKSYQIKVKILPQLTPVSAADAAESLKRVLTLFIVLKVKQHSSQWGRGFKAREKKKKRFFVSCYSIHIFLIAQVFLLQSVLVCLALLKVIWECAAVLMDCSDQCEHTSFSG